ncbi:MAG: ATP-binding protein, partial [Actinobacteria bacterium]|nr:ATP-binding protein [Actinomycetota bacterium]
MLLDRMSECREIDELLGAGRRGRGGALVISGAAGVGKTALLDYALEQSEDYVTVRTAGVETEAHISFSALSDLLRPLLDHVDELPVWQGRALGGALGLSAPEGSEALTLCSSVIGLLERSAVTHPILAAIDDAHLIDARSAETLRFVARRLKDHRIVMLFAGRDGEDTRFGEGGIRRLPLEGVGQEAARELLCASVATTPSPTVVASLIRAAGGNPLALSEYATRTSTDRLRGTEPMDAPPAPGPNITEYFSRGT